MNNSQELAILIKELAKEKNISIGKMLSDCNLSINTLSSMKSGGFFPRVEALAKIADYLECSIDYLLGRTDDPGTGDQANMDHITPHERAVLLAYRKKKDMQKAVDQLLDVKAEEQPSPTQSAEAPQDARLDRIIKLVDTRIASGELDPGNAKIAAFGGYDKTATGKEAEDLAEIKRLVQDVLEEQRKQGNK